MHSGLLTLLTLKLSSFDIYRPLHCDVHDQDKNDTCQVKVTHAPISTRRYLTGDRSRHGDERNLLRLNPKMKLHQCNGVDITACFQRIWWTILNSGNAIQKIRKYR